MSKPSSDVEIAALSSEDHDEDDKINPSGGHVVSNQTPSSTSSTSKERPGAAEGTIGTEQSEKVKQNVRETTQNTSPSTKRSESSSPHGRSLQVVVLDVDGRVIVEEPPDVENVLLPTIPASEASLLRKKQAQDTRCFYYTIFGFIIAGVIGAILGSILTK